MTAQLPITSLIESEVADFFAGFVEIHTELGGPNSIEEAQTQLTERICALLAAYEQEPVVENLRIADALESLLWPNMALGNKVIIQAAIDALRTHPAPSIPAGPDIDMSDADCFAIARLHEIIYGARLQGTEAKLLARFMLDTKTAMLNGGKS